MTVSDGGIYSISEVAAAFGVAVSALRYYEEVGLLEATERRGRVRYYDRAALARLAYLQLWREDGMMSIEATRAVLGSDTLADRRAVITDTRAQIRDRIDGLRRAEVVLTHMLDCRTDRALECPMTGGHIAARVDAALDGTELDDGFLPVPGRAD
ncbi:MerR family transcriptional regulator [Gordonia polyisoprenivorans]|uniref:MerR family transcriptional regulator n=1 Tax=Gordonia polyisoprenivorans TaxID=84595 RepID=UPI001AD7B54D|nr:MerR family transcriptional regulator [Gordonia polyisoprenivorans]QTI67957.1 MerR family transcriptional regulator [Gordonia polyisoprenivorans]